MKKSEIKARMEAIQVEMVGKSTSPAQMTELMRLQSEYTNAEDDLPEGSVEADAAREAAALVADTERAPPTDIEGLKKLLDALYSAGEERHKKYLSDRENVEREYDKDDAQLRARVDEVRNQITTLERG